MKLFEKNNEALKKFVLWIRIPKILPPFLTVFLYVHTVYKKNSSKVKVFKINAEPSKYLRWILAMLPFILTIALYVHTSYKRHQENPNDKIMPGLSMMIERIKEFTFIVKTDNKFDENGEFIPYVGPKSFSEAFDQNGVRGMWDYFKQGESQILKDFMATMYRFIIAMLFIFLGVFVGLFMGCFPYVESLLYRYILFLDKIPAMVLTPVLFIFVAAGNPAIITLVVIAVVPTIILDVYKKVKEVPSEQVIKGMTMKASTLENIFRITYAQIIPKIYDTIRLNFKSIINMLIVGELLGAEAGLGYRIFLVRRFMDMATILPYIIILSMFAFYLDLKVGNHVAKKYPWVNKD